MKTVRLIIPDLFLPEEFAAEVCAGLSLPALEKMLARGQDSALACGSLESLLGEAFGMAPEVSVAAISAAFDGLGEGCWLRADPVHLSLRRDQLVLLPEVCVGADEVVQFCASLNEHFAGQGMEFFAPHPQRWYVRFDEMPEIETMSLSQASGRDVRGLLPRGAAALRWHRVFNEIQMLLFAHPANALREERGELPVNSVWLWGEGGERNGDAGLSRHMMKTNVGANPAPSPQPSPSRGEGAGTARTCRAARAPQPSDGTTSLSTRLENNSSLVAGYPERGGAGDALRASGVDVTPQKIDGSASSDDVPAEMFAAAAGAPFAAWSPQWQGCEGGQLLVWTGLRSALQRGDLRAWRDALQDFETGYAQPLWRALRAGKISQLLLDIPGGGDVRRIRLTRGDTWAFWRSAKPLAGYSMG